MVQSKFGFPCCLGLAVQAHDYREDSLVRNEAYKERRRLALAKLAVEFPNDIPFELDPAREKSIGFWRRLFQIRRRLSNSAVNEIVWCMEQSLKTLREEIQENYGRAH